MPTVTVVGKEGPTVIAATDAAIISMTCVDFTPSTSVASLTPPNAMPATNLSTNQCECNPLPVPPPPQCSNIVADTHGPRPVLINDVLAAINAATA